MLIFRVYFAFNWVKYESTISTNWAHSNDNWLLKEISFSYPFFFNFFWTFHSFQLVVCHCYVLCIKWRGKKNPFFFYSFHSTKTLQYNLTISIAYWKLTPTVDLIYYYYYSSFFFCVVLFVECSSFSLRCQNKKWNKAIDFYFFSPDILHRMMKESVRMTCTFTIQKQTVKNVFICFQLLLLPELYCHTASLKYHVFIEHKTASKKLLSVYWSYSCHC